MSATDVAAAPRQPEPGELVNRTFVKWHLISALFFLLTSMSVGLLIALNFVHLYPFPGIAMLSPGRLRFLHTNEIAYGFLVNGFLGSLYYAIPRLTGRPVASRGLGWFILVAWQATVVLGSVGQVL